MARTATAGEQAVLGGANYATHCRVWVQDSGGTWRNLSTLSGIDHNHSGQLRQTVDQIVTALDLNVWREQRGGESLAPLMAASAYAGYVRAGGGVRVEFATVANTATPGASDWKLMLDGVIDEWGVEGDLLNIQGRDAIGAKIADRWIKEEVELGSEGGVAIETVMQEILDLYVDGLTLYVPTSPSFLVKSYRQQKMSVMNALLQLCALIGWVIEPRWDDGTSTFRLTFYEPDRTPVSTAWTWAANRYSEVPSFRLSRLNVRNDGSLWYTDAATGARTRYTAQDPTSILAYDQQFIEFEEGDDSPIDSAAEAQAMLDPAILDLKDPVAEAQWRTFCFWPVQLGDNHGFTANGVHFDSDQEFGITGITHEWSNNGHIDTLLDTRGKPAGFTLPWLVRGGKKRDPVETARGLELLNFREISRTATTIKYGWTLGSDLAVSLIHDYKEAQPYSVDKWPADTRLPDTAVSTRDVEYQVTIPEAGNIGYFQVEGRRADGSFGDMERVLIFPSNVDADFVAYLEATVNQSDGSVLIEGWTTDRALSVAYAYTVGTNPTSPTVAMAEAQGTGADGGGLVTGFSSDFSISLPAGTLAYGEKIKVLVVAYLNANGTGADGTATDHGLPLGAQGERFKITVSDQITDGIVISRKLREGVRNFNTDIVFSASAWDTVAWTAGTIYLNDGTSYAIDAGNTGALGSDAIRYIYFDSGISATTLQVTEATATAVGEDAIILCVAQRASAGAGQEAFYVPAVGQLGINSDSLGVGSVLTAKLADLAVTTAKVADLAISTGKLADLAITTAKIGLSAVQTAQLDALAVTEAKVAAAAITTDKLAALAVTTGKIALSAIETDQLAALAVTGAKIAANTVTAANIAALTITAAEIAAATITGSKIAAGTITASNIAAGTITATEIAALTITAANIAAATITGAKIAAGTIEAANIAAATITSAQIAAGTIVAANIAGGTITAYEIAAGTITALEIASGAITTVKIAAGAVTANEIAANTITAAKMNVADLSAISANLGTVTAGTIQTNVIVASDTFTATTATFTGVLRVGSSGYTQVTSSGIGFYTSGGTAVIAVSRASGVLGIGGGSDHTGTTLYNDLAFFGGTPASKPTVTGSRGGNAALASLLTGLASLSLLTDSSSA